MYGKNPPVSALNKVGIRRMLLYIQKSMSAMWRKYMHNSMSYELFQKEADEFLFSVNEKGGFWNYEVAVGEWSVLVGIQFRQHTDWTWIEMDKVTESELCNTLE